MVNGYINFPEELDDLSSFTEPKTVPGIYNKIEIIYKTGKPVVANVNFLGNRATFIPILANPDTGIIFFYFFMGTQLQYTLAISVNDVVKFSIAE